MPDTRAHVPSGTSVVLVGGVCHECDESGLGTAVLDQCLANGWRVGVVDAHRRPETPGSRTGCIWTTAEEDDPADWSETATELARRLSASALVNLASQHRWSQHPRSFLQSSVGSLRSAARKEVLVPLAAARGVLREFLASDGGTMVNVCSYRHSLASPTFAAHSANMAALASATASLAAEYGRHGIWIGGIGVGPLTRADSDDVPPWVAEVRDRSIAPREVRDVATAIVRLLAAPDWSCVGSVIAADGGISPFGVGRTEDSSR